MLLPILGTGEIERDALHEILDEDCARLVFVRESCTSVQRATRENESTSNETRARR